MYMLPPAAMIGTRGKPSVPEFHGLEKQFRRRTLGRRRGECIGRTLFAANVFKDKYLGFAFF